MKQGMEIQVSISKTRNETFPFFPYVQNYEKTVKYLKAGLPYPGHNI